MLWNQQINGDKYYFHAEFNNAQDDCLVAVTVFPTFSAPSPVNVGDVVGFDPSSSVTSLNVVKYDWSFGDGTPHYVVTTSGASGASGQPSVFHSYTNPGTYTATLTVTDGGADVGQATQAITVEGPPPAPAAPGSAPVGTTGPPGYSPPGSAPPAPVAKTVVGGPPQVTLTLVSSSLPTVLRKGLQLRYAVNQVLAGSFELLVNSATAHRLHISGHAGAGAPVGSGIEIGRANVVSASPGHATITIRLTHSAVSHLGHTRSLLVTLRLAVANEAGLHSAFTWAATLHR